MIEFLGTGSARPTKERNVSSLLLHHAKASFMFDCGDGTLRQLINSPIATPTRIEAIFITHLHSDHYYGLPGVSVAFRETEDESGYEFDTVKKRPVFSPRGLKSRMGRLLERQLNIEEFGTGKMEKSGVHYDNNLPLENHVIYENQYLQIAAFFIHHAIPSAAYIVREKPTRILDLDLLKQKYNMPPSPLYAQLQRGLSVTFNGRNVKPEEVSQELSGRCIAILGDTCNPNGLIPYIEGCDVVVHEATGLEMDKTSILQKFHSTGAMAGQFAKRVKTKQLILNHFSPRETMAGLPCSEADYQKRILEEAREAAGSDIKVTAAYDHMAFSIPRKRERNAHFNRAM